MNKPATCHGHKLQKGKTWGIWHSDIKPGRECSLGNDNFFGWIHWVVKREKSNNLIRYV